MIRNTHQFFFCIAGLLFASLGDAGIAQDKPDPTGNGDFVVGPDYEVDPDLKDKGNPKGQSFEFSMTLADSKIFPGKDGTLAPILVTFDGPSQMNLVKNALDNLTISKDPNRSLPAFIVIAVENGGNDGKGSERGMEYDTMSDRHARFTNAEVLPALLADEKLKAAYPKIALTT